MSAALHPDSYRATARDFADSLVDIEQRRTGKNQEDARRDVAHRIGILPGTFETLARGRLKRLETWVYARLARGKVDELRREIVRHETELANALRCLDSVAPGEVEEIQAGLEALRAACRALAQTIVMDSAEAGPACPRPPAGPAAASPAGMSLHLPAGPARAESSLRTQRGVG